MSEKVNKATQPNVPLTSAPSVPLETTVPLTSAPTTFEPTVPLTSAPSVPLVENFGEEGEHLKAFWDENGVATLERAAQYSEIGKFHIYLLIVCLIGYTTISTVPYILIKFSNAIQCDYHLIKEDKKAINDIVYVCMILGGVAWSLLADTLSRKWTLVFALFVYSAATWGLTSASTFVTFGFCRGIGAFSLSGIECMLIVFIAEFQIRIFRGSMVCCLQLGWILGLVIIPGLPYAWKSKILLGVIAPVIAMVAFIVFPEPPRFLFSRGREKAALYAYQIIYSLNTGKNMESFPIRRLKDNKSVAEIKKTSIMKQYIPAYLEPKFICIPLLMLTQFVIMFSYFTLAIWFPEMVPRADAFFPLRRVEDIPQDCRAGVYHAKGEPIQRSRLFVAEYVKDQYGPKGNNFSTNRSTPKPLYGRDSSNRYTMEQEEHPCDFENKKLYYKSSTMDALACMPSIIWVVVKVDTTGRKFFIIFAHVIAGCLAFASYFMHSPAKRLLFSCLFDSFTLMSVTIAHCLAVELFPTRVRVFGVALVIGSGHLGAVLADIGVAITFGLSCVVTIGIVALALAASGILMMTLPDTSGVYLK